MGKKIRDPGLIALRGICGIYRFVCFDSGKIYIGSSENIGSRLWHHLWRLRRSNHPNRHLQGAWNTYGETSFLISVVEVVEDKENLLDREQVWLDATCAYNPEKGYNHFSIATRNSPLERPNPVLAQRWIVTPPDGEEFEIINLKKFCRENNLRDGAMTDVANGTWTHHKKWKCRKASMTRDEWETLCRTRKPVRNKRDRAARDYFAIDPDGKVFRVHNLMQFCKPRGLSRSLMGEVASGNRPHHRGWKCIRISGNDHSKKIKNEEASP